MVNIGKKTRGKKKKFRKTCKKEGGGLRGQPQGRFSNGTFILDDKEIYNVAYKLSNNIRNTQVVRHIANLKGTCSDGPCQGYQYNITYEDFEKILNRKITLWGYTKTSLERADLYNKEAYKILTNKRAEKWNSDFNKSVRQAKTGFFDEMLTLLNLKNLSNDEFGRAIIVAASGGSVEVVEKILEKNFKFNNVQAYSDNYESALKAAVENGHTDVIDHILDKVMRDIDAFYKAPYYVSILQHAVDNEQFDVVEKYVDYYPNTTIKAFAKYFREKVHYKFIAGEKALRDEIMKESPQRIDEIMKKSPQRQHDVAIDFLSSPATAENDGNAEKTAATAENDGEFLRKLLFLLIKKVDDNHDREELNKEEKTFIYHVLHHNPDGVDSMENPALVSLPVLKFAEKSVPSSDGGNHSRRVKYRNLTKKIQELLNPKPAAEKAGYNIGNEVTDVNDEENGAVPADGDTTKPADDNTTKPADGDTTKPAVDGDATNTTEPAQGGKRKKTRKSKKTRKKTKKRR